MKAYEEDRQVRRRTRSRKPMSKKHWEVILNLLKIGKGHGFDTYTAHKSRIFRGTRLGSIATIDDISPYVQPDRLKVVSKIDVLWLETDVIRYCFEVVITTDLRVAALRLSQVPTAEKLYIVCPPRNRQKFNRLKQIPEFRRTWGKLKFVNVEELTEYLRIQIEELRMRGRIL